MAILKQTNDAQLMYTGWYGLCKDERPQIGPNFNAECENFPLFTGTGNTSEYIYDHIKYIYEISDNAQSEVAYNGTLTGTSPIAKIQRGSVELRELKCGKCYRIILKTGNGQVDIPDFTYANRSDDDAEQNINNRITDNCDSGGGSVDFSFEVVSAITDVLDEGYINTDATAFDAEAHTSIITDANGVDEITIQSDGNGLEYSMTGSSWSDLGTSVKTINFLDYTSLQLRVKTGLTSGTYNRVITFNAKPTNPAFIALNKSLSYNITVNNVSVGASDTITEEVEEGKSGSTHSFDITFENLSGIGVVTDQSGHLISTAEFGNYGDSVSIPNPGSGSASGTIYVRLDGTMPSTDVTTKIKVIGERRNSGADIILDDAVSVTSTVAPRPQITGIFIDTNTLEVSITVEETEAPNNYGAHHWHYYVKDADGNEVVGMQMPGWPSGGFPSATIPFDFPVAGVYTLCAKIVSMPGHADIPGSLEVEQDFTIAGNDASLSANPISVQEILDIDESQAIHVINISSNNLTNISYTPSLNNWEYLNTTNASSGVASFAVKLKDSVKSTDVSSGPVDLPQEIITITGDVGARDTSGDTQKSVQIPLDAKLMDKAEFTITGANLNVTDNRDFGESAPEFGPYTLTFDAVTLASNSLSDWEVEFINNNNWIKNPDFSQASSGTTFKVRNSATSVGTYNETLTITPTASASDHDSSDNPTAITLNLNSTISPLSANLVNPGTQTLSAITSGDTPTDKTFVVGGTRIENISISDVSAGWSVTPANPSLGSTVTISYTGDSTSVGTKTGTFKISADPITGSTLSTTEYTVNMSLIVNAKVSTISANPNSVTLDAIPTGNTSDTKTTSISSSNVSDIQITNIPSGFIVKNGSTTLSQNDSIGTNATLTISLSNVNSLGSRSGTINLTGTPSANSAFSGSAVKSIAVSGQVNGLATSLSISPTSVTDDLDQNDVPVAHEIALTYDNLSSISISGGNANKYRVSETANGTYSNTLSLVTPATNFFVKLMNTSSAGTKNTNFTISGTKSAIGASNPSNVTLSCSGIVNAVATPTPTPTQTPTPTPIPVAGPSTLWLAFSENGNTSGKYSPFYELKHTEESILQINLDNMGQFTSMAGFSPVPPTMPVPGIPFNSSTMVIFGSIYPLAVQSLPAGVTLSDLDGLTIKGTGGEDMYVELVSSLDHTKFEFVNSDHETEITSWMTSSSTTNLVEVLITESATQPNINSLSPTEIASAFNSPSLSLKCGDTWNGDLSSNKTKLVFVRDNNGIPELFNYGALGSSVPILNSGKWDGAGTAFMNNNALTTVKSPKIMYFYFEKSSSGTKIKFSDGDPSGSHCGVS